MTGVIIIPSSTQPWYPKVYVRGGVTPQPKPAQEVVIVKDWIQQNCSPEHRVIMSAVIMRKMESVTKLEKQYEKIQNDKHQ